MKSAIRLYLAVAFILLAVRPSHAAEAVPGSSCSGFPGNAFQWAGAPENGGIVNGMFCGSTWKGVINFRSSGLVGIATTSPAARLDVNGTLRLAYSGEACDASHLGGLYYSSAANKFYGCLTAGSWTQISTGAAGGSALSSITAATAANTINNAAYAQEWDWNSLAGGSGLKLAASTTAATGNTQKLLEVALSGVSSSSNQTTYGTYIANTHANGGTSVNVGLYASASGADSNYAGIFAAGKVGIGTTAPSATLDVANNVNAFSVHSTDNSTYITAQINQASLDMNNGYNQFFINRDNAASLLLVAGGGGVQIGGKTTRTAGQLWVGADLSTDIAPGATVTIDGYDASSTYYAARFRKTTGVGTFGDLMAIRNDGKVGINTASPAAELDVVGDIHYSGVIQDVSDRRMKDNIAPLPQGQMNKVMQLKPVSFTMKADPNKRTEWGLIAQDVEGVYPDLVQADDKGMRSLNYIGLIAPMIAAMQEQQGQIRVLQTENAALMRRLDGLEGKSPGH